MYQIITGRLSEPGLGQGLADSMFTLRHQIFYERLQWDVRSENGREIDEFDDDHSVYVVASDLASHTAMGCWRLRPTTSPYMLRCTFPELMEDERPPVDDQTWEISRFAVHQSPYEDSRYGFSEISQDIIASTVDFALVNDIDRYVMVTSVAVERMTRRLGYQPVRLGPPRRIGRVLCVALEIPVDEVTQRVAALHRLHNLYREAA